MSSTHPMRLSKRGAAAACHTEGHGPALVLMHGGAGSWTHWMRNIPALRERFTVSALDLPGCGDSFRVPDAIDDDAYIEIVCDAIGAIAGDGRIDLAGFSFGAVLSAMVAARTPERIRRLALVAPGGFGHAVGRMLDLQKIPGEGASDRERRAVLRHNLLVMMFARPESADDATLDIHHANVIRAQFDSRRFSLSEHTRRALPAIEAPTLVIFGDKDNLAWPSVDARLELCRAGKPDIRTALVPGAGHWVQYEAPDAVNRLLIDFFSRCEGVQSA